MHNPAALKTRLAFAQKHSCALSTLLGPGNGWVKTTWLLPSIRPNHAPFLQSDKKLFKVIKRCFYYVQNILP